MKLCERKGKTGTSFYIDYRLNGKRTRKTLENIHDRKTAEIAFSEFRVQVARGAAGIATRENITLGEVLDDYQAAKSVNWTPGHRDTIKARIRQIKDFVGEELPVKHLNESRINDFRRYLRGNGDAVPTINRKTNLIKTAINRAVKKGHISGNPIADIENLSDTRSQRLRFLDEDEIRRLLDVLREGVQVEVKRSNGRHYKIKTGSNERLYQISVFLLNTGARRGEALGLTWKDIDFRRRLVTLKTGKSSARGRRAKVRHIPMNEALHGLLKSMYEKRQGERVFSYRNNLLRDFKRACSLAEISGVNVHTTRHTFASHLVIQGVPLNTVRELLGHSSMTMTLRYSHLSPDVKQAAVGSLNFGAVNDGAQVVNIHEKTG